MSIDPKKTVFIIDGSSFLYRAYYAMRPLHTSTGQPVQAVYGFVRMLRKLIKQYKPEHMVLTWDAPGKTERHEEFEEYKATRQAPPSDLFEQKEYIRQCADMIGLAQIEQSGIEADDLMYSIAADAKKTGYQVVLVTSDKDMGQMLDEQTYMLDTFKNELYNMAAWQEKMGMPICKLPFYFALLGDSSDNIPGVRGIGKKGALELVQQFDSLEQLYDNLDQVAKPRMRTALGANKENAFLSRQLFRLRYHASMITIQEMAFDLAGWAQAHPLFEQLGFTSLIKELPGQSKAAAARKKKEANPTQLSLFGAPVATDEHNQTDDTLDRLYEDLPCTVRTVTTQAEFDQLFAALTQADACAIDTETTGVQVYKEKLVGISLCMREGEAWYIPLGHITGEQQLVQKEVLEQLAPLFNDDRRKIYMHHASFDHAVLWHAGLVVEHVAFDTMVAARLINKPWQKVGLKQLCKQYVDYDMPTFEQVVTQRGYKNFAQVPIVQAAPYAAIDAHQTFVLQEVLDKALKQEGAADLYYDIELPLLQVLLRMERHGIQLDTAVLSQLAHEVQLASNELEDAIIEQAGPTYADINLQSPQQVQRLLFEHFKLPPQKKSGTGAYSTDSNVLKALAKLHPVPGMIGKYRELVKLKTSYLEALPGHRHPVTGAIHTRFSQIAVQTGRLASSDPNLQNIPAGSGYGIRVRGAFVPSPDYRFISADYSQIELRVMAYLSQDERLLQAFKHGYDIHAHTAAGLFDVAEHEVTHEQRQIGKRINFSVLYGMTPYGLSKDLGISYGQAKEYIDAYFAQYPQVRSWMDEVVQQATHDGYVTTLYGRKRYITQLQEKNHALYQEGVRIAVNTRVQGTAAEIMKMGMINVQKKLDAQAVSAQIVLQIHDELLVSVHKSAIVQVQQIIQHELCQVVTWPIALDVTIRSGKTWQEVTK